jgi:hypothetical protein
MEPHPDGALGNRAEQPGFLFALISPVPRTAFLLPRTLLLQEDVCFLVLAQNAFRQRSLIVARHSVLPFQEVRDALWLDPKFNPPQAGQQQIHFIFEARGTAMISP